MINVFVTGSGRCGTSMLAGMFRHTGAFLGERLHPARAANPRGFFEDAEVNAINEALIREALIARAAPTPPHEVEAAIGTGGVLWLSQLAAPLPPTGDEALRARIAALARHEPFCLKDPRFSLTLPSWEPCAGEHVVLAIFREPATTAQSILGECRLEPYLAGLPLGVEGALTAWRRGYARLLAWRLEGRPIRFVPYEHVVDGSVVPELEAAVGCALDRTFPTRALNRTRPLQPAGEPNDRLYRLLLEVSRQGLGAALDAATEAAARALLAELAAADARDPLAAFGHHAVALAAERWQRQEAERRLAGLERENERLRRELALAQARPDGELAGDWHAAPRRGLARLFRRRAAHEA